MNKLVSPTAGSAASSETSETQSVSDDFQAITQPRTTKNWKKIKEIGEKDDKRPPWRMVSVSTLPKADKNALLRAKLLDASRRLRSGKNQIGVQTDPIPTKLLKEVDTQIYNDLIPLEDKEILTDGTITMRQEGSGEFLLTHSVCQMTDCIQTTEAQAQTATPRISHQFLQQYYGRNSKTIDKKLNNESFTDSEKTLLKQIKAINEIDRQLKGESSEPIYNENEDDLSDDSLHNDKESFLTSSKITSHRIFPKVEQSTLPSWHFDFPDDDETDLPTLPRRLYTEGYRPWSSFKDLVIGRKLANMKLSPIPPRKSNIKKKTVTWSDAQHTAVSDLLNEANALLNVFDQMSIILGPELQLNDLPEKDETEITFLSDHWDPILRESSEMLDRKIKNLKNPKLKRAEPIKPEMFDDDN